MLGLDGWDEYTDGWWRETPRVVSPWSASEWKQPLHVEDADALRRRRRRTDGVCWARGPDSSTAQYRSETSSPPSSMLGQFLVVVTFTSLRPPTQARQKRPGSREETVFAVRHEQPFNRSNQREAVCLQDMRWSVQRRARIEAGAAADGAMRGSGKSSRLSTRR